MKTLPSIASALMACALTVLPAKADLLVNPDFNTGDLSGWWTYAPDTVNSSITVLPSDTFSFDSTPYLHIMTHDASSNPNMGQAASVGAGLPYQISLQFRANNWGGAGVGVHYLDASWAQIGWEWTQLYSGNGADTGWTAYTTPTWTTPANTAYVEVRFDAWGWSDTYADNVILNVIPEPGVGALLGVGGLLALRHQRGRARR
jgi:hypothetical protein